MTRLLKGAKAVEQAGEVARDFAAAQWLADDEAARLSIIVEEWVANLFDHAGLGPKDTVGLTLESHEAGIRIRIADRGAPFDPRKVSLYRPDQEDGAGAGAGIDIMRAWAELESYQASENGNELVLFLPIHWQ